MDVKPGYKQTEVGVIPEDWEVRPLASLFAFQNGVNADRSAYGSGVPFINVLEVITHSSINESRIPGMITLSANALSTYAVKHGDVLFNRTSETQEEIGLASVYTGNTAVVFGGFVIRARPLGCTLDPWFTSYALRSPAIRSQVVNLGQGAVRANIGQKDLSRVQFILPTKAEQEAIATALSDADALIESLEQLIAKKRSIKQGAMQELLTGKKRLPGFSGEWVDNELLDLADCLDYLRIPLNDAQRSKMKGDYPYCGANGILDYIDKYCVDDVVILMAEDGGYFDEYATRPIAYRMSGKFWVNNHAHILKAKPCFDQDFLFYSLVHKNILNFLASGTRAKLNKSEMNKITIRLPVAKAEQTAISTVLSDMDAELSTLESKLSKARQIKQGMMQELLTGRVRLV